VIGAAAGCSYDVWGDAVNTASRMESHGEPGRVQVSAAVWHELRQAFAFRCRGTIAVKGKGPMCTFFLLGRASDREQRATATRHAAIGLPCPAGGLSAVSTSGATTWADGSSETLMPIKNRQLARARE
jgi:hypothetical protein